MAGMWSVADNAKFGVSANSVTNSATIGNLTLGSGGATTLDFSYGFTGNPTNAALVAGAVTINGTSAIRIGGTFVAGTFPVSAIRQSFRHVRRHGGRTARRDGNAGQ